MAVAAPSNLALYSDFAGAATTGQPDGWEDNILTGEVGWKQSGSGTMIPTATGWKITATSAGGFTRAATAGGVVMEFSAIPTGTTNPVLMYLGNDKTAGSFDGYAVRWHRGTADFQLQKFVNGASSYLDGSGESSLTGSIANGFKLALMVSTAGVTAYASTDGGSTWQQIANSTDTTGTGFFYAGLESNDSATTPAVTNVWLGLNGSGANTVPPQIVAGTLAAPTSGNTVTPTLPPHQADDILIVCASCSSTATLTCATSGWSKIAGTSNTNYSTAWFWKRATSSAETNPTISGYTTYSTTLGNYATAFRVRGCLKTGTPFENAAVNGVPATSTTPQTTATTTTAENRLVVSFAQMDDNLTITNYPPALWNKVTNQNTANGGDHTMLAIQRVIEAAGVAAQVNTNTQSASAYWSTLTMAFIPAALPAASILKRWDGSAWVTANLKRHNGTSWVSAALKKT